MQCTYRQTDRDKRTDRKTNRLPMHVSTADWSETIQKEVVYHNNICMCHSTQCTQMFNAFPFSFFCVCIEQHNSMFMI